MKLEILSKLSSRDRRAVIVGAASLAAILIIWGVVIPVIGHWMDVRDNIDASRIEIKRLQAKGQSGAHVREQLIQKHGPAACKPLEAVESASISFVKAVPEMLKANQLQIKTISQMPAKAIKELPGIYSAAFQIKANCQMAQLANCLGAVSKCDQLVVIDQVSVSSNEKSPGQLDVTLVMSTLGAGGRAGR